jgi:hypothetical protein
MLGTQLAFADVGFGVEMDSDFPAHDSATELPPLKCTAALAANATPPMRIRTAARISATRFIRFPFLGFGQLVPAVAAASCPRCARERRWRVPPSASAPAGFSCHENACTCRPLLVAALHKDGKSRPPPLFGDDHVVM